MMRIDGYIFWYPRMAVKTMSSRSFIFVLLARCCPTAIRRLVVSVIIGPAVQAVFWWAAAHVIQKVLVTVFPTLANGNSSFSVPRISYVCFSETARFHPPPRSIFPSRNVGFTVDSITIAPNDRMRARHVGSSNEPIGLEPLEVTQSPSAARFILAF